MRRKKIELENRWSTHGTKLSRARWMSTSSRETHAVIRWQSPWQRSSWSLSSIPAWARNTTEPFINECRKSKGGKRCGDKKCSSSRSDFVASIRAKTRMTLPMPSRILTVNWNVSHSSHMLYYSSFSVVRKQFHSISNHDARWKNHIKRLLENLLSSQI